MPPIPKKETVSRKIIYPEVDAKICSGEHALTVQQAKDLLGWEEETDAVKFGGDYLLTDDTGKKIRCLNNDRNRPFNEPHARTLAQDILNQHWRFNGETVIIGKTGRVLSAQHRLIGLVLAGQRWAGPEADHWKEKWPTEPTIDTIVVLGIEETEDVTRTLDNVRPRTLGDVLFTSDVLQKVKMGDRKTVARMLDYAVRLLWERTGAKTDAFAPRRTHSESLDFIGRHPKILRCVKHIYEEDQEGSIGRLVSPGTASGLMYLMAASASDYDAYRDSSGDAEAPSEKAMDMSHWDKAEEFWTLFSARAEEVKPLREAIGLLASEDSGIGGTPDEKIALVAKAWATFLEHAQVVAQDLILKYRTEDDVRYLADFPLFGGIDVGKSGRDLGDDDDNPDEVAGPTPEEVEAEKARVRAEKEARESEIAANEESRKEKRKEKQKEIQAIKNNTVKPKLPTHKEVLAAQTAKAKADDERAAKEKAGKTADGKPAPIKAKTPAEKVSSKKKPKE